MKQIQTRSKSIYKEGGLDESSPYKKRIPYIRKIKTVFVINN
jgi:hypothetical protein